MPNRVPTEDSWLRKFLNVYWLRPENALWRTLSAKSMEGLEITQPSLDLSCGDGILSFLLAGGDFAYDFDIFQGTSNIDGFYDDVDIYNAAPEEYAPTVTKRPSYNITVGTDWKENLLDKAAKLDFYDELVEHDNNDPLPFDDGRFQTVYTNSAYWVENIDLHLREIRRVMADGGKGIIQLKTTHVNEFLELLRTQYAEYIGDNLVDIIDRGRSENKKHLHDDDGWVRRIEDAGLRVVDQYMPVTFVHMRLWDIGLRPISPHMIQTSNCLSDSQRAGIKRNWIDSWVDLLEPFADPGFSFGQDRAPPEIMYVVEPA